MKNPKVNFYKKKIAVLFFLVFLLFLPSIVRAGGVFIDPTAVIQREADMIKELTFDTKNTIWDKLVEQLKKVGSLTFQSTLQTALNTLAFDTATWIGSGADGQKPLFTTEYLKDLGGKARDAATSQFIETLSKEWSVDLCKPSFGVQTKIGLGLYQFNQPGFSDVDCGWQELTSNWTNEFEKWKSINEDPQGFLKKVGGMFDPTANDMAIALTLYTKMDEEGNREQVKEEEQIKVNQGWLDVRNIGGKSTTPPGQAERELLKTDATQVQNLGKFTGNALIDATNIFLNQLAISAFNKYIREGGLVDLLDKDDSSDSSGSGLTSVDADPKSFSSQNYITQSLKKVIKPRFNVRADYNILSDLAVCLDDNNPMPTNCVIDNQFSQAIQNKKTIIGAIEDGFINPNWVFDRNVDYQSGFNYRSLIILRKFRILPLGWEEALTRAEEQTSKKGFRYSLMDMISCFDPNDDYEVFSEGFTKSNFTSHSWCEGLIDPSWVLKAPLNYCKRQGFGGYIMSEQLVDIPDSAYGTSTDIDMDPVIVSRSDNYCADEQSCIKERSDGTCEYYGYCTEEKRIWNFGEDSCDPVYNTCDSFTSSTNGKKLALLKNTIDYGTCSADNVGCAKYSTNGIYSASTAKITWSNLNSIYLNKKAESCSASAEGCQEFIRTTAGSGHNFLINGSFENDLNIGAWGNLATTSSAYDGSLAVLLSAGDVLTKNTVVADANHVISGESYTLSFYSLCTATSTVSLGSKSQDILPSADFSYQALNYTFPSNYSSNTVGFNINAVGGDCFIDNVKLERGITGTFYSDYRGNGLTYQKLIPDYLKSLCYQNPLASTPDFRLKDNAPSQCFNYARLCNNNEIGCNVFTSIYNIKTNAKALEKDYCPSQCSGYDVYVQSNTLFENKTVEKMIPSSASACSASDAGCTEFTNLDEVSAGGEGKEYYVHLRHCIKPAQGSCDNFYSWEGSNESGYQLKSFKLEKTSTNTAIVPNVTQGSFSSSVNSSGTTVWNQSISGTSVCNASIYNLPVSSPSYNPDCREFYNQDGHLIYVLYSTSITCSDNCKPYRMTEKNINSTITSSSACSALNTPGSTIANWDATAGVCYHCLAGGKWDNTQSACVYQAIPGEGKTCSVTANNCREYNGNSGNNIRIVSAYDFNDGLGDWSGATSSVESLNQGGKSMKLTGVAETEVGNLVSEGSSYVLKFSAKANQARGLGIHLTDNVNGINYFGITGEDLPTSGTIVSITLPASSEWQTYQVSLPKITHAVSNDEKLKIALSGTGGDVYISDVVLLEVVSRYYLIKNSWNTPDICYYDTMDNYRGVNYNLGCQPYRDSSNVNHDLRQFSKLCSDSAVGCQMMIQTNNYSSPDSAIFNDGNKNGSCDAGESDCIFVPGDKFVSAVYDASKACSSANMGCSRLGKLISSNPYAVSQNIYQDSYIKLNPNNYNSNLCLAGEVSCDAWSSSSGSGTSYFKDPGDNLCQWRKGSDVNSNFAWYKKAVKKCKAGSTFTNNICSSTSDCSTGQTCELDTADYLCPVATMKTIGYGGASPIYQPGEQFNVKWAGLCPIKQAGCTEYIDPLSSFSPNIILNPSFSDLDGNGEPFDLWTNIGLSTNCTVGTNGQPICTNPNSISLPVEYIQYNVKIEPNKLYIMQTNGQQKAILSCSKPLHRLSTPDNKLEVPGLNEIIAMPGEGYKVVFYSGTNNSSCSIKYDNNLSNDDSPNYQPVGAGSNNDASIEIKETAIDYQLKQNLDFSTCNSQADFNSGCVVFNERDYSGATANPYANLNYNSSNYTNFSTCSGASCDANKLIKVSPDRVCGKWLACYAYSYDPYTDEKTCLEMGECTAFNYDGSCFNFSKAPEGVRKYTAGRDLNASGYSLLGSDYLANMKQVGEDIKSFDFEPNNPNKLNDWKTFLGVASSTTCLIDRPNSAILKNSKVSYPASGFGFMKVGGNDCGGSGGVVSNNINNNLIHGSKYQLSALVNTIDLNVNEKARISVGDNNDWNSYIEVDKKSYWQEVSFEFEYKKSWTNGVVIALGAKNSDDVPVNSPLYFDDIRIEPVLEIEKGKRFVPSSCRLYPAQDSILCQSENENFIANGWYGYCLQKDPANSDVCLLWYPIDAVKGNKGSNTSTMSFTGYSQTGKEPYYCAEMSANFEMLEYRRGYLESTQYFSSANNDDFEISIKHKDGTCPWEFLHVIIEANTPDSNSSNNIKSIKDEYCIPYSSNNSNLRIYACNSTTDNEAPCKSISSLITFTPDANYIYNGNSFFGSVNGSSGYFRFYPESFNVNLPQIQRNSSVTPEWQFIKGSDIYGGDDGYQYFLLINSAGWYTYNGFRSFTEYQMSNENISPLSYSEKTYGSKVWDYNETSISKFKEINSYTPRCTKVVQGKNPWVQRVSGSDESIFYYQNYYSQNTGSSPISLLPNNLEKNKLGSQGMPFGAIKTNSATLSLSSVVFAGTNDPSSGVNFYGLPYSCNSFGKTIYKSSNQTYSTCDFMYLDGDKVKLFDPSSSMTYSSIATSSYENMKTPSFSFKDYLRHIFLKADEVTVGSTNTSLPLDSYNYTAGTASAIPGTSVERTPTTTANFTAVYPKVPADKVQLTNAIGVPVNKKGDTYEVVSAGFYTLSFNTIVDLEQVPISELTIRIKEEKTNWNSNEGFITLTNVDPVPPETNSTHRIFRYLPPGNYKILIKAKDNWGFYSCVGLSKFSSDPVPLNCSKCCVEEEFNDSIENGPCHLCAN